jgi:uncharacterized membrane protein YhaH (DUF805 family)
MMPTTEAKLARSEGRVRRLERWIFALAAIVVFFGIVVPIAVIRFQSAASERGTLIVTCASARANIAQLEALQALERRLGVPIDFRVPEVPPECDGH